MTHATVTIQITSESKLSTPSWMGEVAAFAQILEHTGTLKVVQNQVRFARARARSLRSHRFCRGAHRLHPCLPNRPCWLFTNGSLHLPSHLWPCLGAHRLPHRSTLSRFLAALDPASVEGLRSLCAKGLACAEAVSLLKPRRVSAVLWPLNASRSDSSPPPDPAPTPLPSAPVLWRDWPRCGIRRTWIKIVRSQTICLESSSLLSSSPAQTPAEQILTRAERAHWRLSWDQRLARNTRPADAPPLIVTLHGLPATFASSFGFDLRATA
jgi:hypothetical protein